MLGSGGNLVNDFTSKWQLSCIEMLMHSHKKFHPGFGLSSAFYYEFCSKVGLNWKFCSHTCVLNNATLDF